MDKKEDGGRMQSVTTGSLGLNQLQINQRENRVKGNFVHVILNSVKEWVNVSLLVTSDSLQPHGLVAH